MTDGEALLAAILANPDEDMPRLAYADWLDEQTGELTPRAEFIRVQIAIAEFERRCGPVNRVINHTSLVRVCTEEEGQLRDRERELKDPQDLTWHFYWRSGEAGRSFHYPKQSFFRGFISSVELTWDEWKAHCKSMIRQHPVRKVKLTTWPDHHEYVFHEGKAYRNGRLDKNLSDTWIPEWPGIEFELLYNDHHSRLQNTRDAIHEAAWEGLITVSEARAILVRINAVDVPIYEPPLSVE